jgi:hypothetical protein
LRQRSPLLSTVVATPGQAANRSETRATILGSRKSQ